MKTPAIFLLLILIFCTPAAYAQKNVAVLEIERRGGAIYEISRDEAMEITDVIRIEAIRALPRARYGVMTSETVQAMGDAVLAECAEENCVIALGRKIDAEYIVRGTLSKFQTVFTLSIQMFETEYGNLIATSDHVRSENLMELLDKCAGVSAAMFKMFLEGGGEQTTAQAVTDASVPAPKPTNRRAERRENIETRERKNSPSADMPNSAMGWRMGGGSQNIIEVELSLHKRLRSNRLELGFIFLGEGYDDDISSAGALGIFQGHWNVSGGVNWYAGVGAGVGYWSYGFLGDNKGGGEYVDIISQVGVEYNFGPLFNMSFDVRPTYRISDGADSGFGVSAGISARYIFGGLGAFFRKLI